MRNSRLARSILFCLLVGAIAVTLNFLMVPLSSMKKKFNAYRSIDRNIDFLVLGDSLEGDGVSAQIISERFGVNAFVFAPQGGYPECSYYLLVDVLKKHTPRTVVVGWDILQNFQQPAYQYPHSEELYRELLKDARGNPPLRSIILEKVLDQRYTSTFFEWASFPKNILRIQAVQRSKRLGSDNTETQKQRPINVAELETYSDFHYLDVIHRRYATQLQETDKDYMEKIKDLCDAKNIRLYVLANPIPDIIIEKVADIPDMRAASAEFFSRLQIPYIDALDQTAFPLSTVNANFKDCFGHVISPYREIYTGAICDAIEQFEESRP